MAGRAEPVRVGDTAPDFTLPSQTGEVIRLSDLLARQVVVLYFYPKDESRGCTTEACAFRDRYEAFQEAGAVVVGVSADSVASHARFAARNGLPFLLLSDAGSAVRRRYGVARSLGIIPGRATYVIDRQSVVRHMFVSQLDMGGHIREALQTVTELASEGRA